MSVKLYPAHAVVVALFLSIGIAPSVSASMGLGADARKPATEWAELLSGLDIVRVEVNSDHVAIKLAQDCAVVLAHETGSQCAGLFMDAGNARACLKGTECPVWQDFQRGLSTAGAVFLPWREVSTVSPSDSKKSDPNALQLGPTQRVRLHIAQDEDEAAAAFVRTQLGESDTDFTSLVEVAAAAWRVGAGREALSSLGQERWLEAPPLVVTLTRLTLLVGPRLALHAIAPLVEQDSACAVAPIITAFELTGRVAEATELARLLVGKDPQCFDAFERGVMAASRGGDITGALALSSEAIGRFAGQPRLTALSLEALTLNQKWLAIQTAAEPLLKPGVQPFVLNAWTRYLSQAATQGRVVAAWTAVRDQAPENPWALYALGVVAHYRADHQTAVTLLLKAAEREPSLAKVGALYGMSALSTFALGDVPRARALALQATEVDPLDSFSYRCRGEVLRQAEPMLARKTLQTAVKLASLRSAEARLAAQQLGALTRCIESGQQAECEGPWRVELPNSATE